MNLIKEFWELVNDYPDKKIADTIKKSCVDNLHKDNPNLQDFMISTLDHCMENTSDNETIYKMHILTGDILKDNLYESEVKHVKKIILKIIKAIDDLQTWIVDEENKFPHDMKDILPQFLEQITKQINSIVEVLAQYLKEQKETEGDPSYV